LKREQLRAEMEINSENEERALNLF